MAINDVQEIKNASLDKTWRDMMWKVIILENGFPGPIYEKYKIFKTPLSKKIRLFPNAKNISDTRKKRTMNDEGVNSAEIFFEPSINERVLKIYKEKIVIEEEKVFNDL